MVKPDNHFISVETKFQSGNEKQIMLALREIRVHGKASILPLVFGMLRTKPNETIKTEIFTILNQLKDKNCIPAVIAELESNNPPEYITEIISSCWQSGLDYSAHIKTFTNLFVKGNYLSAFEAFTVIEEWIHNATPNSIAECKKSLMDSLKTISGDKKLLYLELVKLFESHIHGIDFTSLSLDSN